MNVRSKPWTEHAAFWLLIYFTALAGGNATLVVDIARDTVIPISAEGWGLASALVGMICFGGMLWTGRWAREWGGMIAAPFITAGIPVANALMIREHGVDAGVIAFLVFVAFWGVSAVGLVIQVWLARPRDHTCSIEEIKQAAAGTNVP